MLIYFLEFLLRFELLKRNFVLNFKFIITADFNFDIICTTTELITYKLNTMK